MVKTEGREKEARGLLNVFVVHRIFSETLSGRVRMDGTIIVSVEVNVRDAPVSLARLRTDWAVSSEQRLQGHQSTFYMKVAAFI